MMVVLAEMGRRSEALARYERLVDDLLDAFGTDPDPQTAALFPRAVDRLAAPKSASTGPPARPAEDDASRLPATTR